MSNRYQRSHPKLQFSLEFSLPHFDRSRINSNKEFPYFGIDNAGTNTMSGSAQIVALNSR